MNDVTNDPNLISQFGAQFEQMGESSVVVTTTPPASDEVTLPGGFLNKDGVLVKTAKVRELNGADEEAIFTAGKKALETVLSRGLVELGNAKATSADLDDLLSGDRDAILLAIRTVTFGKDVEVKTVCQSCSLEQDLELDIEKDIPIVELDNPVEGRSFTVDAKVGEVVLNLPNGITQKRITEALDKSPAEIVTALLSGCVASVNGSPSMGKATALGLSISDRELLVDELSKRNPGPRLGEVTKACKACGYEIYLSLIHI